MNQITKARETGISCAQSLLEAVDHDHIVHTDPLVGDWDHLCEELGDAISKDQEQAFLDGYADTLINAISRLGG